MLGAPSRVEATPRLKPDPPCLSVFPRPSVPREGCGGRHPSSGCSSRRSPPVPSAWSRSLPNGLPKSEGARREPGGRDAGSVRRTADRPARRCVQRLGLRHGSSGLRPCGSGTEGSGTEGEEAKARAKPGLGRWAAAPARGGRAGTEGARASVSPFCVRAPSARVRFPIESHHRPVRLGQLRPMGTSVRQELFSVVQGKAGQRSHEGWCRGRLAAPVA